MVKYINNLCKTQYTINLSIPYQPPKNPIYNRIGESNIMTNGMRARIINYKYYTNIDIEFEDGVVVTNCAYNNFIKGAIAHPLCTAHHLQRIGQTKMMNNGMNATIIGYRNSRDIDIQFEDGTIVYKKTYRHFSDGKLGHPNILRRGRNILKGKSSHMKNGLLATIIAYNNQDDIDIQFENGIVVNHQTWDSFKRGEISLPNTSMSNAS